MEAVVYQCPNCGAPLEFNSETQRWDCKFCLSSFEKEQLEQMTDEQKKKEEEEQQEQPAGGQMCYHCPNCGAQLIRRQHCCDLLHLLRQSDGAGRAAEGQL